MEQPLRVSASAFEERNQPASEAVVEAVAEAEGVDPVELSTPLYRAVDPDALNRVIDATPPADDATLRVAFTYAGYRVTVAAGGEVAIAPAGDASVDDCP